MKFFNSYITILKSSYQLESSVYPCGVQDIPEPSHQSNYLYSKLHNQLPKSADPNSVSSTMETLVVKDGNFGLSTASPNYSRSTMADTQYADERDLYSQHLSKFSHSLNCKSELSNLCNAVGCRQSEHDTDTSLSKPSERLNLLRYVNYAYTLPWVQRYEKFIETESSCTKSAGF
jgi:hypothetical protein